MRDALTMTWQSHGQVTVGDGRSDGLAMTWLWQSHGQAMPRKNEEQTKNEVLLIPDII
jgi:hypothetical protein